MNKLPSRREERLLRLTFEWTLALKGLFAVAETIAGIGVFFVTDSLVLRVARALTREELLEDPRDFLANYVTRAAEQFSTSSAHFMGVYLATHGLVKLAVIVALIRRKLWAYPLAIAVFGAFIVYQIHRYAATKAFSLLLLTVLDLVVIGLTIHEYRYARHEHAAMRDPGPSRRGV